MQSEYAAASGAVFDVHGTAVDIRRALDNGEAQPGTAESLIGALEPLRVAAQARVQASITPAEPAISSKSS